MGLIFFVIYFLILCGIPLCELYFLIKRWQKRRIKFLGVVGVVVHSVFLVALVDSFRYPGAYNFSGHGTSVAGPDGEFELIVNTLLTSIAIFILFMFFVFSLREFKE